MNDKFLDQAEAFTTSRTNIKIAEAGRKAVRPLDFNGDCECGQEIPKQRVQLGYYRCVPCQSVLERRGKLFAK